MSVDKGSPWHTSIFVWGSPRTYPFWNKIRLHAHIPGMLAIRNKPRHDKSNIVRVRQAWIQTLQTLLQVEKLQANSMDPD
jgi:hypothetical protein